jgi:GTPase SAR1 family protein
MVEDTLFKTGDPSTQKQFKVICVGESMAGKTSLIQRYMTESFSEHGTQPTLGSDFKIKNINLELPGENGSISDNSRRGTMATEPVRLFIWDTAG